MGDFNLEKGGFECIGVIIDIYIIVLHNKVTFITQRKRQ